MNKDTLLDAINSIRTKFGEGAIMQLGKFKTANIEMMSTGSILLDRALGGGIPRGRIIEIFGMESSGKTTLASHIIAEAQKRKETAAFIDVEHAYDPEYSSKIGVDNKKLYFSQPETAEKALEIVEILVKSGKISVIIIDSVAALTPRAELEGEMGASHIGLQARLMNQAMRKLSAISSSTGTTLVFLNQIRMKINSFGNPETQPGGLGLKFYASQRMEMQRGKRSDVNGVAVSNVIKVRVAKNKIAAPFRSAELNIRYNVGIDMINELVTVGVEVGVITKAGSFYQIGDQKINGMEAVCKFLTENKDIEKELRKKVIDLANKIDPLTGEIHE